MRRRWAFRNGNASGASHASAVRRMTGLYPEAPAPAYRGSGVPSFARSRGSSGVWYPRGVIVRPVVLALCALLACAADPSVAPDAAAEVPGAAVLIPASPEVAAGCAAEVTSTVCGTRAAEALAAACGARLRSRGVDCAADGCVAVYRPQRAGVCAAGPTYASAAACAAVVADDCAFYRACMEAARPCGADGYALAYGERLCHAFIARRGEFSPAGQAWLRGVRTCLQRALVPLLADPSRSCGALEDAAYASHTGCYTAAENSLCALPPADLAALTRALAPWLRDPRAQRQIGEVLRSCTPVADGGAR